MSEDLDRGREVALMEKWPVDQWPCILACRYLEWQRKAVAANGVCEGNCEASELITFYGRKVCRRTRQPCPIRSFEQRFLSFLDESERQADGNSEQIEVANSD